MAYRDLEYDYGGQFEQRRDMDQMAQQRRDMGFGPQQRWVGPPGEPDLVRHHDHLHWAPPPEQVRRPPGPPGWLVVVRYPQHGHKDMRMAVLKSMGITTSAHGGSFIGMASGDQVQVASDVYGKTGWTGQAVLLMKFPAYWDAKIWSETVESFKQFDFPLNSRKQIIAIPLDTPRPQTPHASASNRKPTFDESLLESFENNMTLLVYRNIRERAPGAFYPEYIEPLIETVVNKRRGVIVSENIVDTSEPDRGRPVDRFTRHIGMGWLSNGELTVLTWHPTPNHMTVAIEEYVSILHTGRYSNADVTIVTIAAEKFRDTFPGNYYRHQRLGSSTAKIKQRGIDDSDVRKGWLVLIRFGSNYIREMREQLLQFETIHGVERGMLVGIARAEDVAILEGGNPAVLGIDRRGRSRHAYLVMKFETYFNAEDWLNSTPKLKQPDFPDSDGKEVIAVPLSTAPDSDFNPDKLRDDSMALLVSIYTNIREGNYLEQPFYYEYLDPFKYVTKTKYHCYPHICESMFHARKPERNRRLPREAYQIGKGFMMGHNDVITVSWFPDMPTLMNSHYDSDRIREQLGNRRAQANVTSLAMIVRKF